MLTRNAVKDCLCWVKIVTQFVLSHKPRERAWNNEMTTVTLLFYQLVKFTRRGVA